MQPIGNLPSELQNALAPYLLVPGPSGRDIKVVPAAENPNLTPRLVHLREGVVIAEGLPTPLQEQMAQYHILADAQGRFYALHRPCHQKQ